MAMRRETGIQDDLVATWAEMPRSPGHAFYDRLQALLKEAGFDAFVEDLCKPYYAPRMGAPSLPPGRYFRMHMVGYFEGIDSERGICWRCSDSLWLWCMDLRISISGSASVFESLLCLSSSTHRVATISPEPSTGS